MTSSPLPFNFHLWFEQDLDLIAAAAFSPRPTDPSQTVVSGQLRGIHELSTFMADMMVDGTLTQAGDVLAPPVVNTLHPSSAKEIVAAIQKCFEDEAMYWVDLLTDATSGGGKPPSEPPLLPQSLRLYSQRLTHPEGCMKMFEWFEQRKKATP